MKDDKCEFTMSVVYDDPDATPTSPLTPTRNRPIIHFIRGVCVGLMIAGVFNLAMAFGFIGSRPQAPEQKRGYPWTTEGESPANPPPKAQSGPIPTHEELPDGRIVPLRPVTSAGPLPK